MRLFMLALAASLCPAACRVSTEDASSLKVINGRDASQEFPAVVTYYMTTSEGEGDCTGTFVSDTTMISAAHCVAGINKADAIFLPNSNIKATAFKVHPNFSMENFLPSMPYDMAVIKFPPNTAPATLSLVTTAPKVGDQVTIIGFGQTDLKEGGEGSGTKRAGTNQIARLEAGLIMYSALMTQANTSGQQAGSSYGDSGGPLLINGALAGTCSGEFDRSATEYTDAYVSVFNSAYRAFLSEASQSGFDIPGAAALSQAVAGSGAEVTSETINSLLATARPNSEGTTSTSSSTTTSTDLNTTGGVLYCLHPDGSDTPCTAEDLKFEETSSHAPGSPECRDPHYHDS